MAHLINPPPARTANANKNKNMPIPEFNEIKAPALQFFADGAPHKVSG